MTQLRRTTLAAALLGVTVIASCTGRASASSERTVQPQPGSSTTPKLVLFITIDQFRGDYPSRYEKEFKYGLKRLLNGGAWFQQGYQDHGITETAPGHASTMSGRFPRSTGIASNSIGVVDTDYRLLTGTEVGASPKRFQGTTLYDWIAAQDRKAKAFSVSMKDRGAILPIGRAKEDVYWYSPSGAFTTSNYYRNGLPEWVTAFNARHIPQSFANAAWRLSRDTTLYTEVDDVKFENRSNPADNTFPHAFPLAARDAASYLRTTPMMDSVTALFALAGLRETGVGRGPHTDVMAVSFSATDYVGHAFGPDSREAHENMLRLDETLGWFIDSVYKMRDSASVIIAMTGDHGVSPIPELARERGQATGTEGLRVNLRQQVAAVRAGLEAKSVDGAAFLYDGELVGIERTVVSNHRLKPDSILNAFANTVRQVPGVARVDWMSKMRSADTLTDPVARRWAHQIPETMNVEIVITLTNYSFWSNTITATHGSPYDQDAWVPILFYGPGVKTGRYSTFARTVDMAPTLAALLGGVKPLEKIDGVVLTEAVIR
jgi:predicted AlkP superfamily pyrophosphatase or phosphodiesterase